MVNKVKKTLWILTILAAIFVGYKIIVDTDKSYTLFLGLIMIPWCLLLIEGLELTVGDKKSQQKNTKK